MNSKLLHQLYHQTECWKRLLEFIQSENAYLKMRISEVASGELSGQQLDEIEGLQTRSIRIDELIRIAKFGVFGLQARLHEAIEELHQSDRKPDNRLLLENHIQTIEQAYNILKNEFNHFVAKTL